MKQITLTIAQADVYAEIAQTTSYIGAKQEGDGSAYDRIFTTDEDQAMLARYWVECKNVLLDQLKRFLISEDETDGTLTLTLEPQSYFSSALTQSIQENLFSYFVTGITSKWNTLANKPDAEAYATEAATFLEDIMRKLYHKTKPTRPTY